MNTIMHMIMIMGVLINMNIIMNPKKRHRTEFFPLMSGINSCACKYMISRTVRVHAWLESITCDACVHVWLSKAAVN